MRSTHNHPEAVYEIQVRGELDRDWQEWFNGLDMTRTGASAQPAITTLTGRVADQAALRGMLNKLWDLNLTLLSVRRIQIDAQEEKGND